MPTVGDAVRSLERSEADLRQASAILECLSSVDACPPAWMDELNRLRAGWQASAESVYQQVRATLPDDQLAAFDARVGTPYAPSGLLEDTRQKVDVSREEGGKPLAQALVAMLGMPRSAEVTLTVVTPVEERGKAIWIYVAGAAILAAGSAVVGYFLHEDPGTGQIEAQSDQYAQFLGAVGPMLTEIAAGIRTGTLTPEVAAELLRRIRELCPENTLSPLPGVASCTIGSCGRFFLAGLFGMFGLVLIGGIWYSMRRGRRELHAPREPKALPPARKGRK